ncbi:MAG: hypothetical protein EBT07_16175 [Actinobacteria bacterium]|nr:hypothetical protein [Actinomycetota bacterium]
MAGNPAVTFSSYESIATVTVGSGGSSTVTFSSIPSTYSHLQVRFIGRSSNTGTGTDNLHIRINSDSGSNYAEHYFSGTGAITDYGTQTSITNLVLREGLPRNGNSASIFSAGVIDLLDYTSTNKNKTIRSLWGHDRNGAGMVGFGSGLYFATPAAISTLTFTVESSYNFVEYSKFALYGIKGA